MRNLFAFIFIIGLLASCNLQGVDADNENEDLPDGIEEAVVDTVGQEEDNAMLLKDTIDGEPNEMVFQRDDGLRIEWTEKNEDRISASDVVLVNYTARVAAGEEYESNKSMGEPVPLKADLGILVPGLAQGLQLMHVGDKGRVMVPAALGYGENGHTTIVPPDADLIYDIKIVDKIEPILLEDGVKVYKWKTEVGGAQPEKNQTITFDYFAYQKSNDPGLYDNSYKNENPFSFKFKNDNVVDGLHIGMSVMKPGENAFIEIPAKVAYGSKGMVDLVPSNTDIVYDVRVISIQ